MCSAGWINMRKKPHRRRRICILHVEDAVQEIVMGFCKNIKSIEHAGEEKV